jgi:hypothetical protein
MMRNADDDGQMAEKIALHSCMISHNLSEQNHIIVCEFVAHGLKRSDRFRSTRTGE